MLLSIAASMLFALLASYAGFLAPLDGAEMFAWRVIWTLPGAFLLIAMQRDWKALITALHRLRGERRLWLAVPIATSLLSVQLWLFLWAPANGHMLDVSMGYFLLPISTVLAGRFFLGERLGPIQWVASLLALGGVVHEIWSTATFSWISAVIMLGYPPYFMLRRWLNMNAVVGFMIEIALMLPVAAGILLHATGDGPVLPAHSPWLLLPGLGIVSAAAMGCYMASSQTLPLGIFGMLGFIEPVLLFLVAVLFFDEKITVSALLTYGPIWAGVLLVLLHAALPKLPTQRFRSIWTS
ncbi:EamA family transporter RarD [Burkholderia sp. Bp9012]|uniref:EamA family transporter RarD n=1 Tax=Burkholderia sp. Bp9012 TaxID=2184562 RepID=UPI0021AB61AC|nr:EamA family transporter RarD [Burkholderia sp. Bp9012]